MGTSKIILAGFGGQGILFSGKFLAYAGLIEGREISWLPSYGPEMRGGTANCSVVISDAAIGSPIVTVPDIVVAMNLPSLDKFEKSVAPGGHIFVDNALISRKVERGDVNVHYIPATQLAFDHELKGLANMIMVGKILRECGVINSDSIPAAMKKVVPERKKELFGLNIKAIDIGYNFE